jgi:hypothetical protein
LPATSALSKKKITAKKMKRFNLIQPPSGKSYDRHFEIIIECCRTIRLSDYQTVGLSGCRIIRLSDYQTVGLSGCRIIRLSDYSYAPFYSSTTSTLQPRKYVVLLM